VTGHPTSSIDFSQQKTFHNANAMLRMDQTNVKLAQYHHAAFFQPAPSTFIQAIKWQFSYLAWPHGRSHLSSSPRLISHLKRHLKQVSKNLRSTQPDPSTQLQQPTEPPNEIDVPGKHTHECYITLATKEDGTTYSDLAGHYLMKLSRGKQFIIVVYNYDSNAILTEAIKTRAAGDINKESQNYWIS
jgi:hypothetical protein